MEEKKTFVIKRPDDLAEMIRSENVGALETFLEEPLAVIAGVIMEVFSHGRSALAGPAVRIVQGAFKGRFFKQLADEVKQFREKGKIADDFAESKYGFQSWVELLTVIDEDTPDEDRLEALKAMFFSINKVNTTDAEQILGYQLFQIAKRLTSNELLVLKAVYELQKAGRFREAKPQDFRSWADLVAKHLGHMLVDLIDHADSALVDNRLLGERYLPDRSGIGGGQHGRLTDLGLRFCENIERYRLEKSDPPSPK